MPVMPGGSVFDNEGKPKANPIQALGGMMRPAQQQMPMQQPGQPLQPGMVQQGVPGQQQIAQQRPPSIFSLIRQRLSDPFNEAPQQPRVGVPGQPVLVQGQPGAGMVQPQQQVPNAAAGQGMVRPQSPPINMGAPEMSMRSPYTVHLMPEFAPQPAVQPPELLSPPDAQPQQGGGIMSRFGGTWLGQRLRWGQQQVPEIIEEQQPPPAQPQHVPGPEYGRGAAGVQQGFQPQFGAAEQYTMDPLYPAQQQQDVYAAPTVQMQVPQQPQQEEEQPRRRQVAMPFNVPGGMELDYDASVAQEKKGRVEATFQRYVLAGYDVEGQPDRFVVHGLIGSKGETIPFENYDQCKAAHATYYMGNS